jgi:outer membrane protein assembly factor BamB
MRRALLGIGLLCLVSLFVYTAWRGNAFNDAPLKWKVAIDEHEGVWQVDKDSIYCVASAAGGWGTVSSLCRVDRDSGKILWRRKKRSKGEIWETEYPFCWTSDTGFASSSIYDRKLGKTTKSSIIAISLRDGNVLWKVPVSPEIKSMALGKSLYCITNDGRFTTHQVNTGATISELDLRALAGSRISYGSIELYGDMALVGSNLSQDYANPQNTKVFLINLKTNRLIAELPKGEFFNGKYVVHTGEAWQSFDLNAQEPKSVPMNVPEYFFLMHAADLRGSVAAQWTDDGLQLLDSDAKPMGSAFPRNPKLKHISNEALYIWDYNALHSVNRRTGAAAWTVELKGIVDHVRASSQQVLVRSRGDTLYCFDAATGALRWKYYLNQDIGSSPRCEGGEVIVKAKGKLFYFSR